MSSINVNRLILTGENPFIRLSQNDGDDKQRTQILAHPSVSRRAWASRECRVLGYFLAARDVR